MLGDLRTTLVLAGGFWAASACERSHRPPVPPTAAFTAASPHPEVRPAPERCGMCFAHSDFILRRARLAEEVGADALLMGLELRGLSAAHLDAFRVLIASLRGVYRGRIGHGVNGDEVEQVTFWDTLDFIGVQLYAPLPSAETPLDLDALRGSAERWRARYEAEARLRSSASRPASSAMSDWRVSTKLCQSAEERSPAETSGTGPTRRSAREAAASRGGASAGRVEPTRREASRQRHEPVGHRRDHRGPDEGPAHEPRQRREQRRKRRPEQLYQRKGHGPADHRHLPARRWHEDGAAREREPGLQPRDALELGAHHERFDAGLPRSTVRPR